MRTRNHGVDSKLTNYLNLLIVEMQDLIYGQATSLKGIIAMYNVTEYEEWLIQDKYESYSFIGDEIIPVVILTRACFITFVSIMDVTIGHITVIQITKIALYIIMKTDTTKDHRTLITRITTNLIINIILSICFSTGSLYHH